MQNPGSPQVTPLDPEDPGSGRDPEDRAVAQQPETVRDKMLDKTLADSFPTSDPPSTIPDPTEDSFGEETAVTPQSCSADSERIESPYDRLTHATSRDAEGQPLPAGNAFDRQPQPAPDKNAA